MSDRAASDSSQLSKKLTVTSNDFTGSDIVIANQPLGNNESVAPDFTLASSLTTPGISSPRNKHRPSWFEQIFSPCGADITPRVVYYVVWDWASKVTVISFNASNPLLITHFGDVALGENRGKLLWTYLTAFMSIFTAMCFLTFMAVIEFEQMKRKTLFYCGFASSACLILFASCYNPQQWVYFACFLAVISRVAFNVSNLAFDSLLYAVSANKDSHQISSRSFITGYIGMIFFAFLLLSALAVAYYGAGARASFVLYGIIPNTAVGIWYLLFGFVVQRHFPIDCGIGPPFPPEFGLGIAAVVVGAGGVGDVTSDGTSDKDIYSVVSSPLTSPRASTDVISTGTGASSGSAGNGYKRTHSSHNHTTNTTTTRDSGIVQMYGRPSDSVMSMNSDFDGPGPGPGRASLTSKHLVATDVNSNSNSSSTVTTEQIGAPEATIGGEGGSAAGTPAIPVAAIRTTSSASALSQTTTTGTNTLTMTTLNRESYSVFGSIYWFFAYGLWQGTKTQLANLREFHKFPDLFVFMISFIFIEGAQNTGVSLAAIIIVDIFSVSNGVVVVCAGCGLVAAIVGLYAYKLANARGWLTPKQILLINIVVFIVLVLGFLFVENSNASILFVIFAIVGGSQIGSVGAFARSLVAQMCPAARQSRVFSLYQFCQVSTAWVGPLIIASVNSATGGDCEEFLYLTVLVVVVQLVVGLPLLIWVDVARGVRLREHKEVEDGFVAC